ncbi:MAG: TonB-dependent receptor [Bacteroidales bacterium]|nr:TonB-dependent receptor [Bacteroidales bacterium]
MKLIKIVFILLQAGTLSLWAADVLPQRERIAPNATAVQGTVITGTVTDETGQPMPGVSIQVKGTLTGTVSDAEGKYSIHAPSREAVLVFSFVGYAVQELPAGDRREISITLVEDNRLLEEVVVVGYGVQKKSNLTGSVAVVKAEALETRPVSSISAALAGQMPGVTTIQRSGQPGVQTGSITIRGKNTLNAASPLVIVDGVPGSMNDIPMEDIVGISVLKDAASSAIYGVQAANGVILITTRRGRKDERTKVSYSGNVAWVQPTTRLKFLGSGDYAMLYNEATLNENPNATLRWTDAEVKKFYDGSDPANYPNTDWYRETFKSHSWEQSHYLSVNGGSEKTAYNASLQYLNQGGLVDACNYQRFNGRINLDSQISPWFAAGMNLAAFRGIRKDGWDSFSALLQYSNRISPTEPVYKNGDFNYPVSNPVAHEGASGFQRFITQQLLGTVYGTINFLPNLSLKGVFSVRNQADNYDGFKKHLTYSTFDSGMREGYDRHYSQNHYTMQVLANYHESWGNHNFAALGGFEQYLYTYKYTEASRKGGGNDELTESLNTLDASSQANSDGGRELARRSFFGRLQYNYDSKYLAEANFRCDASSIFPEKNRWGLFPALSAGWVVSREDFLSGVRWLSNLKLRAGWGQTGNEEVKSNDVYPSIATYAYDRYVFAKSVYSTIRESRYVNPDLKWATVTNYELGIEASVLNHMLSMELALYKKQTRDMLLYLPVTAVLGMVPFAQNAGKVENKGFDLNLSHQNSIGRDWKYNVYVTLAYVKNRITDMAGTEGADPSNSKYWFLEGHPIGSYYGYKANGFFNTDEELKNEPKRTGSEKLGDIKYVNLNPKDGNKIDAANDRTVIGQDFPSWTTGLGAGATYRNIDFYCFFQGAFDVDVYTENEMAFAFFNGAKVLKRHLDRWTPDHHQASYPRITRSSQTNFQPSSFWLQNASYVRLKNVSLGYTLPKAWIGKLGLEKVYVYLSGENLLTFSSLEGIDPEAPTTGRGAFYANNKKVSLGLKVSF